MFDWNHEDVRVREMAEVVKALMLNTQTHWELAAGALIALEKRITVMDANVSALAVAVAALGPKVDQLIAAEGKIDPADEAAITAAVTGVAAVNAKLDAALAGPTGATGPAPSAA